MTTNALRKELQQYIERADERFLRMVHSLAKEYTKTVDKTIGHHLGKPIKRSQLLADLEDADKQIDRGEFITIEDLEKESETW